MQKRFGIKDSDSTAIKSLIDTIRDGDFWPHGCRSKYIFNPRGTTYNGNHVLLTPYPETANKSSVVCDVKPKYGALYHMSGRKPKKTGHNDISIQPFEQQILKNMKHAINGTSVLFQK